MVVVRRREGKRANLIGPLLMLHGKFERRLGNTRESVSVSESGVSEPTLKLSVQHQQWSDEVHMLSLSSSYHHH